jgi:hypothetical protein
MVKDTHTHPNVQDHMFTECTIGVVVARMICNDMCYSGQGHERIRHYSTITLVSVHTHGTHAYVMLLDDYEVVTSVHRHRQVCIVINLGVDRNRACRRHSLEHYVCRQRVVHQHLRVTGTGACLLLNSGPLTPS